MRRQHRGYYQRQFRERQNLLAILEKTQLKIKGPDGVAELFDIKPITWVAGIRSMSHKQPKRS